jgi:hypothetical protein
MVRFPCDQPRALYRYTNVSDFNTFRWARKAKGPGFSRAGAEPSLCLSAPLAVAATQLSGLMNQWRRYALALWI